MNIEEEISADEIERLRQIPRRRVLRLRGIPAAFCELAAWTAEASVERTSVAIIQGQLDVCARYDHARLEREQPAPRDLIALMLWMLPIRLTRGSNGWFVRITWETNCDWGCGRDREGRAS